VRRLAGGECPRKVGEDTEDEAVAALEAANADYRRHSDAARAFPVSAFAADKGLERLLADCDLT